jgi:hypothetical protein
MMATGSQTRSAEHPLGALVKQKFVPSWCSALRLLLDFIFIFHHLPNARFPLS